MDDAHPERAPTSPRPRGFLGATFGAFFSRLPTMLFVGALTALPHALWIWHNGGVDGLRWWVLLGNHAAHLIGLGVVTGLVLHDLAGDRCSLARMAGRALRRLPAMGIASLLSALVLSALFWLGIAAARHAGPLAPAVLITTLIIVAGLASSLRLAVTAAFVERRGGTACMARSMTLTRGRRLRIFFAQFGIAFLISPLTSMMGRLEPGTVNYLLAEIATRGVVLGLMGSFAAVVYADLRARRDGDAPEAIAADLAE